MAAGVAALQAYERDGIFERVAGVEASLRAHLGALAQKHACIGEVRGTGAFFGIELVGDRETREPLVPWQGSKTLGAFTADLLKRGLYVFGRYNVIVVAPPLVITDAEIAQAAAILDEGLGELA
jgi:taurine--2-oxoglutarate transaminase